MKNKKNEQHKKKIKRWALICTVSIVLISVSTYAWFIGMRTVNVSGFDINIATTESLYLSLNGQDWDYTVNINEENYDDPNVVYANHTNSWGNVGLIPMSSVGKINADSSRLVLYEKGSFTASPGGYRIMASEVKNSGPEEANGYVAFDLFIKNLSGEEYYGFLDDPMENEEAIYLTPDSSVGVSDSGVDAEKTGIENSVRVAFAQIGRVIATTTDVGVITGINCTDDGNVTSICSRSATIWEPNDTKHVENAINWYNTSCLHRDEADITSDSSYAGACGTIRDGVFYPTYAISGVVDETDQVDNYDGAEYNGWTTSISNTPADGKLYAVDTFTDTEKYYTGTDRPPFMYLAPNSITKVRVYIYLEGQDVDNYDFAQLGRQISVNFGFTKERFTGEDVDHTGPELPDGVVATRTASYTATKEVTNISNVNVTYDNNAFSVPNDVNTFTFTDDGILKQANYITATVEEEAHWVFTEVNP